jgi:hypothetical protein
MTITINGSGTVTGIVAGGLPDASVTQKELSSNVAGTGPMFSAYLSAAASVAANAWVKVVCNTEEFDTNGFHDIASGRFQPTIAGYYLITGMVNLSGGSTGGGMVGIAKNNGLFKRGNIVATSSTLGTGCLVSALVYFNGTTDYVELWVYAPTATTTNAGTGSDTYFQGMMVRAA